MRGDGREQRRAAGLHRRLGHDLEREVRLAHAEGVDAGAPVVGVRKTRDAGDGRHPVGDQLLARVAQRGRPAARSATRAPSSSYVEPAAVADVESHPQLSPPALEARGRAVDSALRKNCTADRLGDLAHASWTRRGRRAGRRQELGTSQNSRSARMRPRSRSGRVRRPTRLPSRARSCSAGAGRTARCAGTRRQQQEVEDVGRVHRGAGAPAVGLGGRRRLQRARRAVEVGLVVAPRELARSARRAAGRSSRRARASGRACRKRQPSSRGMVSAATPAIVWQRRFTMR